MWMSVNIMVIFFTVQIKLSKTCSLLSPVSLNIWTFDLPLCQEYIRGTHQYRTSLMLMILFLGTLCSYSERRCSNTRSTTNFCSPPVLLRSRSAWHVPITGSRLGVSAIPTTAFHSLGSYFLATWCHIDITCRGHCTMLGVVCIEKSIYTNRYYGMRDDQFCT